MPRAGDKEEGKRVLGGLDGQLKGGGYYIFRNQPRKSSSSLMKLYIWDGGWEHGRLCNRVQNYACALLCCEPEHISTVTGLYGNKFRMKILYTVGSKRPFQFILQMREKKSHP